MKYLKAIIFSVVIIGVTALFYTNLAYERVSADDDYRYESADFKYEDVKFTVNGEKQKKWKYHEENWDGSFEEKTNKYDFLLYVSDKEQKLKLGIKYKDDKLSGEYTNIGRDKIRIKVTGYSNLSINKFGEPIGITSYDIDSRVKLNGTDVVVPKGWTGLIIVQLADFRNGSSYTEDILEYGIYISGGVAAVDSSVSLYENETYRIKLTGQVENITYKSANKKVALVSKKGLIKGVGSGSTDILVMKDGVQVTSVRVSVYESHLMTTRLLLEPGEKHKLYLRGTDAKIESVKSSDKSIATVSSKGVIKAKKNGTATITVTDTDGKKYSCKVYVWISCHDVQEKLMKDIPEDHNLGSYWGDNSSYHGWKGGSVSPGEYACTGYAAYLSDVIMGDAKAYYYKDIYGLLPGDIVTIFNGMGGSHAEVVVDIDYSQESEGIIRYYMWSGNYNWSVLDSYEIVEDYWRIGIENMSECGFKRVISRYDDSICKRKMK